MGIRKVGSWQWAVGSGQLAMGNGPWANWQWAVGSWQNSFKQNINRWVATKIW